ncbi:serine hydrolase domain-containing protein [Enterococcus rotai]|uniref:serine hydrolase domain-containing protein n=1 Tax=Enterococcus rotai TaxID=118060 RepID=UPI0035C6FBFB
MNLRWKWFISFGMLVLCLMLIGHWFIKQGNGFFIEHSSKKQASTSSESKHKETINQLIEEAHFQGTALIIHQGQIFYQQSYGYADAQTKVPNKNDSLYPIASLQKIITGSLILELVREDQLTLDTTLDHFYPEIDLSQTITIQQLLNHNSGIFMEEKEPEELLSDQDSQLENALNTLSTTSNKEFLYTNGNYTLLAGIISKLTGQTYEEVVQKRVINKLALRHTYFWDQVPKNEPLPKPYFYMGQDYQADPFPASEKLFSSLLGAGNLYMSTEDFWVFIQSLANGQLFEQKEYARLASAGQKGYQAGLFYFDDLKYSEGNLGGYDTVIYGDQKNQNLVILFANQPAYDGMNELSETIYHTLLDVN